MKLSSDESRAIAFVLGLVALAGIARFAARPRGTPSLDAGAPVDVRALEAASEKALKREQVAAKRLGAAERVDVNGAGAEQLDRLPGVGPALAARIVEERERAGAFANAADLRAVKGVGPALLARLEPHLAFGPGQGLPPRSRSAGGAPGGRGGAGGSTGSPGYGSEALDPARGYAAASAVALPAWGASAASPDREGPGRDAGRARPDRRKSARALAGAQPPERLDVNRASAQELERLPGIGPALAGRIVAKRDSLRGFRSVADLEQVRGIGPATLRKLRLYFRE